MCESAPYCVLDAARSSYCTEGLLGYTEKPGYDPGKGAVTDEGNFAYVMKGKTPQSTGKCTAVCSTTRKQASIEVPTQASLTCSSEGFLSGGGYDCVTVKEHPLLKCMNDRQWRSPGAPSDEATLRNLVIEELRKVGACTLEECQAKSDKDLAAFCADDSE